MTEQLAQPEPAPRPTLCPHGHLLNQEMVTRMPCIGSCADALHGHDAYPCSVCHEVVYSPPHKRARVRP